MTLKIIEASYYTKDNAIDCTKQVRNKVINGSLVVVANNDLAGDPQFGKKKRLRIRYVLDGVEREKISLERQRVRIGVERQPLTTEETIVNVPIETEIKEDIQPIVDAVPKVIEEPIIKTENPNMTDIIIPSYQNEHLTIACFESIKACTNPGTYRIIWVDNGSDSTKNAKNVLKGVNHIAILLRKNHGFVGAVNKGWAKSDAPTVCLLNNDTEVSPRWLGKLTNHLYSDPELGIVGPLTGPPAIRKQYDSHHNIAYQQAQRQVPVFPYYRDLNDFNLKIENQLKGVLGEISFVAFLCAVIKREVIEKVTAFHPSYSDGLDTKYKMGMWDDCDYNWAIEKVGYKKAIALDTCIIHKGRSTFKIMQEKERFNVETLLKKNRKYMDKKMATIEKKLSRKDDN